MHLWYHCVYRDVGIGIELACLDNSIDDGARTCAACQTSKDMNKQFKFVSRVSYAASKCLFDGVVISRDVGSEEQTSSTALLSGSMSQVANGTLYGSGILNDAAKRLEIVGMVEHLVDINLLDEQEFRVCERCILAHYAEVVS